jgi:phosphatidylinositol alpha-mannosyltransferase
VSRKKAQRKNLAAKREDRENRSKGTMKIALVSPYDYAYPGGVNNHIASLEENFIRMGHEVKIIAPSSKPKKTRENGSAIVIGKPVAIRASGSVVRSPVSPMLLFSDRIRKILEQEKFDVVHIHEPLMPALAVSVLHHAKGMLIVGTFHATRTNSFGYTIWKPLLKRWMNKLDGKIAVSKAAMEFVNRYFPGDYVIIPNGIDLERFTDKATPVEKYRDDKLNILFVGRVEKRKGFKYLLGAYERVKREFPQCRLIVVSPASRLSKKYEKIAVKHNLKDVVFAGYVSFEDLPSYYNTADIFCSPATGWESFGMVLMEAMATGKPVIASDIPGYAGLISHGVEGLLVKPQDEKELASALMSLLRDKSMREKMGEKGKLKAKDYSWEVVARKVMEYYEKLLQSRTGVVNKEIASACQGSSHPGAAC